MSDLMQPPIEELVAVTGSKFLLAMLAGKRARQINEYYRQLGEGVGKYAPPQVHTTSRKPLTVALEEIAAGKITFDKASADSGSGGDRSREKAG
jgi:DNA-directed RNA polymerase subunit omega